MHPKPCVIRDKPSRILYSTLKSTGDKKDIFLRYFYQHAEFISSGKHNLPGTLADVDIEGNKINSGFLAFLRLIGTAYFKKHSSGFSTTPDRHVNNPNPLQQHCSWLDDIRQTIWDRIQFESEMIPSTEALYRHWRRTCWVLDMWKKANNNHMVVHPLLTLDGKLSTSPSPLTGTVKTIWKQSGNASSSF